MTLLVVVVGALALLWLVSLVGVLTNADRYRNGTQMMWLLVVLFCGPLGAILYQCLGPDRTRWDEPVPDRRTRARAIAEPWSEPGRP